MELQDEALLQAVAVRVSHDFCWQVEDFAAQALAASQAVSSWASLVSGQVEDATPVAAWQAGV